MRPKVIAVVGPTASGKSDLAIALARRFRGEVVSADSRQVYRGMDIGTGKVTKREQRLARHWLLDVADPRTQFTAADFQRLGRAAVTDILSRGKLPIVCGGTGFYVDALLYDTPLPAVPPNRALRMQLERQSTDALVSQLTELDPDRAAGIDPHNRRRLVRALEIVLATGKPVPPPAARHARYDILWLGVTWPKAVLDSRIATRLDARLRRGMVAEVRRLHAHGVSWERLDAFGLEYRWVARFLRGNISRAEMRDGLLADIRAYAKRQMTWFKRNKDIAWISGETQAMRLTERFLR